MAEIKASRLLTAVETNANGVQAAGFDVAVHSPVLNTNERESTICKLRSWAIFFLGFAAHCRALTGLSSASYNLAVYCPVLLIVDLAENTVVRQAKERESTVLRLQSERLLFGRPQFMATGFGFRSTLPYLKDKADRVCGLDPTIWEAIV